MVEGSSTLMTSRDPAEIQNLQMTTASGDKSLLLPTPTPSGSLALSSLGCELDKSIFPKTHCVN